MSTKKQCGFVIIEDSRERHPLDFSPYEPFGVSVKRVKRRTGDYTIEGFERQVLIERKAFNDCVSTLTHGRERFTREMYDRGAFAIVKHLVVEASFADLSRPYPFAPGANPESIVNSLFALTMPPTNLHVYCTPSRALIAWYIVKVCAMFIHRVTNGSSGMWRAIFAPNAADLAPFDDVPKGIGAPLSLTPAPEITI